jgi:glycosyltransferase involved in cell wall biosynthesis
MATEMRVLLATAGRPVLLRRTLESLARCSKPGIYRETIVVENGKPSGAQDIVRSLASASVPIRYLHVAPPNKSHALNVAIRDLADDCLVYFTDDDIQFDGEVLERFAAAAAGITSGTYFGGPFEVDYERQPPSWLVKYLPWSAQGWMPDEHEIDLSKVFFLGFNWAAFAGDLRAAGMFDPTFGPGSAWKSVGQETDMQVQLRKHGCRPKFVAGAMVSHHVAADRSSLNWAVDRVYRNGVCKSLRKRRRGATLAVAALAEAWKLGPRTLRLAMSKLSRDAEAQFYYRWRLADTLGRIRGYRLTRLHDRQQAVAKYELDTLQGAKPRNAA